MEVTGKLLQQPENGDQQFLINILTKKARLIVRSGRA